MKKWLILSLTLVAVVGVAAASLFLFRGSDKITAAMPGPTAVGVPTGSAAVKTIGLAGGSLTSTDGRITVDVPPNAVTGPVDFSIQPITNLASGGLGSAYRLEPGGNFSAPIKVSLKLDDQDLVASPAVAYQDEAGVWQAFKTADIDQAGKLIRISTTHFTDFAGVTYKLIPEKATVRVGETLQIKLVGCREEDSFLNRIQKLFTTPHMECSLTSSQNPQWSADFGKLVVAGTGVTYTAPSKRPPSGSDEVVLKFNLGPIVAREVSKITIIDKSYAATGADGPTSYSGTICDLSKPFSLTATNAPLTLHFSFTPAGDGLSGTGTLSGSAGLAMWTGGGDYTVEGLDGEKPKLVFVTAQTVKKLTAGMGTFHIDLVPVESFECK